MQTSYSLRLFLFTVSLGVGMAANSLTIAGEQPIEEPVESTGKEAETQKLFPRFEGAGGVYRIKEARALDQDLSHKLLLDVTAGGSRDQVHPGLQHAARALNLYALANVAEENVSVALVVHGKATPIALTDAAYRREFDRPNPNSDLLHRLKAADVDIRVCGQALRHYGFHSRDVLPSVDVDLSAMTTLVELQNKGYSLIPD